MPDFTIADLASSTAIDIVILSNSTAKRVTQEMDDWMTKRCVRIVGEELAVVEDLCRKLPFAESMRCHTPPLGLRFYRDDNFFVRFQYAGHAITLSANSKENRYSSVSMEKALKRLRYSRISRELLVLTRSMLPRYNDELESTSTICPPTLPLHGEPS